MPPSKAGSEPKEANHMADGRGQRMARGWSIWAKQTATQTVDGGKRKEAPGNLAQPAKWPKGLWLDAAVGDRPKMVDEFFRQLFSILPGCIPLCVFFFFFFFFSF